MLLVSLIKWWYGAGWATVRLNTGTRLIGVTQAFSVPLLLRTLFAPWRRIVVSGKGLDGKIQAFLANAVGRLVGFSVRVSVLAAASFVYTVFSLFGIFFILLWPLVPPLAIIFAVGGFIW